MLLYGDRFLILIYPGAGSMRAETYRLLNHASNFFHVLEALEIEALICSVSSGESFSLNISDAVHIRMIFHCSIFHFHNF